MKPRVAVIGAGYWGKNLVRNFHELGVLSVVCDSDETNTSKLAETYPDIPFVRDCSAVLADESIAAVAIATPAVTHYELARRAIEAGKDVFVEKPLATDISDGEKLVALADAHNRILMVGHILRYHPAVTTLQNLIADGELGQIQYLYSNRLNMGKIRTEENILWSFAPHDISVMLALLGEMPEKVTSQGGNYLHHAVSDVTMSQFEFPSGVQAHIFVSWLHPFKEQRLVVVGSEKMAVFDDTASDKLTLYPHKVQWKARIPTAVKATGQKVPLDSLEPLRAECDHFLTSVETRCPPLTDGREGLRVLRILDACQRSVEMTSGSVQLSNNQEVPHKTYFAHDSAYIDDGAEIGAGTKVWHFSHVMKSAKIGNSCTIGQNVNVDGGVEIGCNVKIQNNVSVYTGTIIEDDVFLGPSCVLTNVTNPRSQVNRHSLYEKTLFKRGATIGANATIVCGVTVGRYAFVGAGSVVTKDLPDYALAVGNPARQQGWMSRHGHRLPAPSADGITICPESGFRYQELPTGELRCLDLDEEAPLPETLTKGTKSYPEFKREPNITANRGAQQLPAAANQ